MTVIQNAAPAPPRQIAVETPMIFPVPTQLAVLIISAWKGEVPFPSVGFAFITRKPSGNIRTCTKPMRIVK